MVNQCSLFAGVLGLPGRPYPTYDYTIHYCNGIKELRLKYVSYVCMEVHVWQEYQPSLPIWQ
jgi:hypothetical protein